MKQLAWNYRKQTSRQTWARKIERTEQDIAQEQHYLDGYVAQGNTIAAEASRKRLVKLQAKLDELNEA